MRPRGPPFGTCRGYRDTRQPIPQGPASAPRNPPETVDARVYNPSVACDANTTPWMIARHLASPPCRDTVDQRPRGSMHAVPVHDPYEAPADEVNGQAEPDQLSPSLRKPANGGGTAPKPRCGRLVNRVQQRTESVMPRARGHSLQATAEVNRPAFGDPFHRNRFFPEGAVDVPAIGADVDPRALVSGDQHRPGPGVLGPAWSTAASRMW